MEVIELFPFRLLNGNNSKYSKSLYLKAFLMDLDFLE